jgi:hypothetical protein
MFLYISYFVHSSYIVICKQNREQVFMAANGSGNVIEIIIRR